MQKNKDLIIGFASGYSFSDVSCWVNSLDRSGFTGDKVLFCHEMTDKDMLKINMKGYKIPPMVDGGMSIHSARWLNVYKYLSALPADKVYRRVLMTDVKDIIFQYNPSLWFDNNFTDRLLIMASEGIRFDDESWIRDTMEQAYGKEACKDLKGHIIINSGSTSGSQGAFTNLAEAVYSLACKSRYWLADQHALNLYLARSPAVKQLVAQCDSSTGYAATMGTYGYPEYQKFLIENTVQVRDDGTVYTGDKPFMMVHQYNRVSSLDRKITDKYWEA
jgi:hypothetical protein